jgi:uncharacterized protein (DUF1684 family)
MKNFLTVFLIFLLSCALVKAQNTDTVWVKEILSWQEDMNREFADSAQSPLTTEDRMTFKSLRFFPVNADFRVSAQLELTPDSPVFPMKTSGTRTPLYRQFGILHFVIHDTICALALYQNQTLMLTPEYKDYFFIPFADATNDIETYHNGRFLDLELSENTTIVTLDFNKAYNPLCAYNKKYSCPIPPIENVLPVRINAGVIH